GATPDFKGDTKHSGSIDGGWRIRITTSDPVCCNEPCALSCPGAIQRSSEPGRCGAPIVFDEPPLAGASGVSSCSPPSRSFIGVGGTTGGCTGISSSGDPLASCGFDAQVTAATATSVEPASTQYSDVALLAGSVDAPGCPTYAGMLSFMADGVSV